jgi:hypothetical protein
LRASFRAACARIVVRGQVIPGLNFADMREFVQTISMRTMRCEDET